MRGRQQEPRWNGYGKIVVDMDGQGGYGGSLCLLTSFGSLISNRSSRLAFHWLMMLRRFSRSWFRLAAATGSSVEWGAIGDVILVTMVPFSLPFGVGPAPPVST